MIRIHLENKEYVDVKTSLKDYIETASKIENTKYNWLVFNNQVIINFAKIVYVEEMEENDEDI